MGQRRRGLPKQLDLLLSAGWIWLEVAPWRRPTRYDTVASTSPRTSRFSSRTRRRSWGVRRLRPRRAHNRRRTRAHDRCCPARSTARRSRAIPKFVEDLRAQGREPPSVRGVGRQERAYSRFLDEDAPATGPGV